MPRNLIVESVAWATLDQYIRDNPKPRMLPRARHRAKLFLIDLINGNFLTDMLVAKEPVSISNGDIKRMLAFTKRDID